MEDQANGSLTMEQALRVWQGDDGVVIPPTPLRRLAALRASAEGAAAAAQAAIQVANQRQELLQRALTEACEDQGLRIPPDEQRPVDLDWVTGHVRFK